MPVDLLWNGGIGTYVKARHRDAPGGRGSGEQRRPRRRGRRAARRIVGGGREPRLHAARPDRVRAGGWAHQHGLHRQLRGRGPLRPRGEPEDPAGHGRRRGRPDREAAERDPGRDGGRGGGARPPRQLRADAGDLELDGSGGVDGRGARALRAQPRAGRHAEPRAGGPADRGGLRRAPGGRRRADRARVRNAALAHEDRARRRSCWPPTCRRTRTSAGELERYFPARLRRGVRGAAAAPPAAAGDHRLAGRQRPRRSRRRRPSPSGSADETGAGAEDIARAYAVAREVFGLRGLWGGDRGARRGRARRGADRDAAAGAHPAGARDAVAAAQPPQADRHRGGGCALRGRRGGAGGGAAARCSARPSSRPRERRTAATCGGRRPAPSSRSAWRTSRPSCRRSSSSSSRRRRTWTSRRRRRCTSRSARELELHWLRDRIVDLPRETRFGMQWRAPRFGTTSTPSRRV